MIVREQSQLFMEYVVGGTHRTAGYTVPRPTLRATRRFLLPYLFPLNARTLTREEIAWGTHAVIVSAAVLRLIVQRLCSELDIVLTESP